MLLDQLTRAAKNENGNIKNPLELVNREHCVGNWLARLVGNGHSHGPQFA
jgi:hypothetical protein